MSRAYRSTIVDQLRAAGCVFAEDEADILLSCARDEDLLAELVARRVAGIPLEQVVGWADFCGVRITVADRVFVPRARTALLVDEATRIVEARRSSGVRRPVIVDLCCGSGAVGAVLALRVPDVELHAADIDPAAVRCARSNVTALSIKAEVHEGDLYAALPDRLRGRIDLLAANVPYVPTDEVRLLPAEARLHEHRYALDGGPDGLQVLRRVAGAAPAWLSAGAAVLVEVTRAQACAATEAFSVCGLRVEVVSRDEPEATVVIGYRDTR